MSPGLKMVELRTTFRLSAFFLAPNRGLGARRGLLKRVDFLDQKSDQKKFRQGLALKR